MIEAIILITLLVMMAKPRRRRRRRMGKYLKGNVDENLDLGTLASGTLVSADFDETVNERTLISSLVAIWTLSDFTPADGSGPIVVGVAHSDYTDAEIEAVIENAGSWNEGDLVSQEVSSRKIRKIGMFATSPGGGATGIQSLNDGKPIKTKLNWILNQGQTISLWAYNMGSAAVGGTDPNVNAQGHVNLWPR